jgi:hypothetical protein
MASRKSPPRPDFAAQDAAQNAAQIAARKGVTECAGNGQFAGMSTTRRNNTIHMRKRVPPRFKSIEPRDYVWISLHTGDTTVAAAKAPEI